MQEQKREFVMWGLIMLVLALLTAAGVVYLSTRLPKFAFFSALFSGSKAAILGGAATVILVMAVLYFTLGIMDTMIIFIHVLVAWLLCDAVSLLFRPSETYVAGIAAVAISVLYLSAACYCAHHIVRTQYTLSGNGKTNGEFTVVGFSDSHMGAIFKSGKLAKYVERMNSEAADAAVIVGDFVDDSTDIEEMRKSCAALADLKTKNGVFYVFGNHDPAFDPQKRGYGKAELITELEKNGVTVLQDEVLSLPGGVELIGRQDRSVRARADMADLMNEANAQHYSIVLDHQPGDYAAQEKAGVDLVLSGHTHGGQIFPCKPIMAKFNDFVYGHTRRGNTDFIVSSGIADWAIDFKSCCVSEYFVVKIR